MPDYHLIPAKGEPIQMNNSQNAADIVPQRVSLDNKFRFKCHKKVKCFTQCCRGIKITLTPYDVIRLKNRLGLPGTHR